MMTTASKKKVSKKATKKVTKKAVDPKEAEIKAMEREAKKQEKLVQNHLKRIGEFGEELNKLVKKYNVKLVLQGFDNKAELPFLQGFGVKTELETEGMKALIKRSLNL